MIEGEEEKKKETNFDFRNSISNVILKQLKEFKQLIQRRFNNEDYVRRIKKQIKER